MRKNIITQAWLADFYAEGVKPKYKGSLKRQAASNKQPQPEVASDKPQASSIKHQASSEDRKSPQASSDKQQAS